MPLPSITTPNYFVVTNPTFQPAQQNILSITNANPAVITTTMDGINPSINNYQTGMIMRLNIPYTWGMQQANQFKAPITVLTSSTFSMPVDTTLMDQFVVPTGQPTSFGTPATVVNVGETNDNLRWAVQNILPYPLNNLNPIE
jgi:hypothetical protein